MSERTAIPLPGGDFGSSPTRQSQSERLRKLFWEQILRGELRPGEIVIESELARKHDVSKTPVREALQNLAMEGLVTVLPRKGYLIRGLSFSDIHEVMDLRLILEPRLLRVVAANPPPGIVAELRDILKEQFRDGASLDEQLDAATNFHLACMRASRSTRAVSIVSMLTFEIERLHYLFPAVARHVSSKTEYDAHNAIIAAIAAGDADEAEKLMQEHLHESNIAMVRAFSEPGATMSTF